MAGNDSGDTADEWKSAYTAARMCAALFAEELLAAKNRLVGLAADGLVQTHCLHLIERSRGTSLDESDCLIPRGFWEDFPRGHRRTDWQNGTFEVEGAYHPIFGETRTTVHGVSFNVTELNDYYRSLREPADPDPTPAEPCASPPGDAVNFNFDPKPKEIDPASLTVVDLPGFGTVPGQMDALVDALAQRLGVGAPPPAPKPSRRPKRADQVSDVRLTAWYRKRLAKFPGEVHHVVNAAAEGHFKGLEIGKNQLYRVMRAVNGGPLSIGNPKISGKKAGN